MSKPKFWAITFSLVCCGASFLLFVYNIIKYKAYDGYLWMLISSIAAIVVSLGIIIASQNKYKILSSILTWVCIIALFLLLLFIIVVTVKSLQYQWKVALVWILGIAMISILTS